MIINLLSIDLVCDACNMPYKAIGNFLMQSKGNEFRIDIKIENILEMSIKEMTEALLNKSNKFSKAFEEIQETKVTDEADNLI